MAFWKPEMKKVYVWDGFVRLFHWSIVALVGFQWISAELEDEWMDYHLIGGYVVLGLVAFRILWGFVGSRHARFSDFVRGIQATLAYARALRTNSAPRTLGHNPLGGWMVLALLGLLAFMGLTGLFASDDVMTQGPLSHLVSDDIGHAIKEIHEAGFNILLALVGLHVAAIAAYRRFKGENLAKAMVTGYKETP